MTDSAAVIAELQHGCRTRLDPELVFNRYAMHVVASAERAVFIGEEFGYQEERNALHAVGRVGRARQHEMDDVLRHVVLAVRDENLRAEHLERAVALRLGARANQREIGARLRFGEIHRAGPLA